jgi:hypothetical protein
LVNIPESIATAEPAGRPVALPPTALQRLHQLMRQRQWTADQSEVAMHSVAASTQNQPLSALLFLCLEPSTPFLWQGFREWGSSDLLLPGSGHDRRAAVRLGGMRVRSHYGASRAHRGGLLTWRLACSGSEAAALCFFDKIFFFAGHLRIN